MSTPTKPASYKKPPKMTYWDSFKHTLTNFLLASTIHGLRYWYEGRNWFEKLVWVLAVLGCFGYASYTIKTNLDEGFEDPILTTLHTTSGKPHIVTKYLKMSHFNFYILAFSTNLHKLACLVTLFDPKVAVFKMSPNCPFLAFCNENYSKCCI